MAKKNRFEYGVLKGTVIGHKRDADDDHYQLLVNADGVMYRIAVNVHSSENPPDLLFQSTTSLPADLTAGLTALKPGFTKLESKPGGLAQDFVRGGIVKLSKFEVVPGDQPGADNDLKDTLEDAAIDAMDQKGSVVYAFGAHWGPETKKDQYFQFTPGNGIHDIHMNQGNDPKHSGDDGTFRDGCLFFGFPNNKFRAFFMAFQSQTFKTDDATGHALERAAGVTLGQEAETSRRPKGPKTTKKPAKKAVKSAPKKPAKKTKAKRGSKRG